MGDQAQVDSANNPSALSDDPVFKNVYNAFQLGWSIIELKSRIQVAASGTSTTTDQQSKASQGPAGQSTQKVISNVENGKKDVFLPESQPNPTALPDSAWLTSLWRATFNRIVECHKCCFPKGTTAGTLYNLPPPLSNSNYDDLKAKPMAYDASSMYLPYRYLNPSNGKNYSDVGVQLDTDMPVDFTLYDVTRRTLNCLTLLYTNPEVSLIPETVSDFQKQLMQNVLTFTQLNATIQAAQSGQSQGDPTTPAQPVAPQGDGASANQTPTAPEVADSDQKKEAVQILSTNAIRFLETWDTYARETLYVRGGDDLQANEIQLVAYEAGRAMASLSWGITTTIVPIENTLSQDEKSNSAQQQLVQAWQKVFEDRSIASLQRQISALSTAMDDAYYRAHPDISRPNPNVPTEGTNLALPSQTIQAVMFSLDYWKRAVQLICNGQPDTNASTLPPGGISKPVTIPSMTTQASSQLRLALVQQAEIWQPLLLRQQSLLDFTTQYVTQRILNDFMSAFEQATSKEIQDQIRRYRIPLIIGGGVILLLVGLFVLLLILVPSLSQALVSGFALVVGGIVGFFGTAVARLSSVFSPARSGATTAPESAGSISAIPGLAGDTLVEAFQNGYNQILIEFDYLNHNVSITYPLVEYFILHSNQLAMSKAINTQTITSASQSLASGVTTEAAQLIKDAYDFLTQIAWTNQERADEIGRIARAAFGPIGAFVGAQISLSSAQNNKSSTKKK